MIELQEAQRFVFGLCRRLPPVKLALSNALGCVVSEDVIAIEPIPPFANSSMDGYALRADDTVGAPIRLVVIGSIMAGHVFPDFVGPGQAVRIMTGASLPPGADAVCMIEETEVGSDGSSVAIGRHVRPGEFVRQPGRDVAVGDVIASAGTKLTPAHLGVLASQGFDTVTVSPHPRVGVLSSGDELFTGKGPLPAGSIRDANRHTLLALTQQEGWTSVDLGVVGDDESDLIQTLTEASETCDAIITSGGVSVGDLDLVRIVLEKLCDGKMRWMQVAIKPAKPFAFGTLAPSGVPVFGLPGNPVSAMVSFELFVRPALRRLAGHDVLHRPLVTATTDVDLHRQVDGKVHFLRAEILLDRTGTWHVTTINGQESHQLHAMAQANGLIVLPDGPGARAGEPVRVLLIHPDRITDDPSIALSTDGRLTESS